MRFTPLFVLISLAAAADPGTPLTRNVVLVTADGLRWQEVFHGIDPMLAHEKSTGMEGAEERRKRYERPTEAQRREALMPFFWTQLAPRGAVFSDVKVTNGIRVSYPGYSEILTGRANDALIHSNRAIQNPNETVLEFAKRKLNLRREQVALLASWQTFRQIGEHTEGSIFINAGYQSIDDTRMPPPILELSRLQFHMLTPWDEARHDYITGAMGLEYLRAVKPRVLMISFDETDDWAHDRRYDRVLDAITEFDRFLERLWHTIESVKELRGRTTLIVTSDHGRGSTLADWHDHGKGVEGADRIWLAIIGPDTKASTAPAAKVKQCDIAPTIIKLLGLNPSDYPGVAGSPIEGVFER